MSIKRGFEGYLSPLPEDESQVVASGLIVIDTNVLLDLYSFETPTRETAVGILQGVRDRLWVPAQVAAEFWRNRAKRIHSSRPRQIGMAQVQEQMYALLNSLRPDNVRDPEFEQLKSKVQEHLQAAEQLISDVRGEPLDTERVLRDTASDPVLQALDPMLDGRVGEPWDDDTFAQMVVEGRRRFDAQIPPGFADAHKGAQLEEGTGDFLMWEQTLQHLAASPGAYASFAVVTGDSKPDWRLMHPDGKTPLGVLPELVAEAHARTGLKFFLLRPAEFYRLAGELLQVDMTRTESLLSASREAQAVENAHEGGWSPGTYRMLLRRLAAGGYDNQRQAIRRAASRDGTISRDQLFELAGFEADRSLVRFAMPAVRIASDMVAEGELDPAAPAPLWATYEGPGKATGYQVPPEFCDFETLHSRLGSVSSKSPGQWGPPRVQDLADELQLEVNELLAVLRDRDVFVADASSPIPGSDAEWLRREFGSTPTIDADASEESRSTPPR